jgi:phosphate-selective porin OprO and OprP
MAWTRSAGAGLLCWLLAVAAFASETDRPDREGPTFSGRLFLDLARYQGRIAAADDDLLPTSLRLGIEGDFTDRTSYELVLETAGAFRDEGVRARLRVATLSHRFDERLVLTIGQQDEPFSLEAVGSAENLPMMERALPNALAPAYHTGLLLRYETERGGAAGGVFGRTIGPGDADRGRGASARAFASPVREASWTVHVGSSLSWRTPGGGDGLRIRSLPESALTGTRLVDTGSIADVRNVGTAGVELVVQRGPTTLQAEVLEATIARRTHPSRARLGGYYLAVGHFLTGERRRFDTGRGVWRGVDPSGDGGAVELVARWSELDLDDADVRGGSQRNVGIGLNWYPSKDLRLMANWLRVRAADDDRLARARVVQFRMQIVF